MRSNLAVIFIFSLMACSAPVEQIPYGNEVLSKLEIKEFEGRPKNIILLIGDGTGLNQITLSRMAISGVNSRLYIDQLPYSGISLTHSADNIITDSAAAATAWATGAKTKNKFISLTPNEGLVLSHLLPVAPEGTQVVLIGLDNDYIGWVCSEKIERKQTEQEIFRHQNLD